jgi:hypothetical protein
MRRQPVMAGPMEWPSKPKPQRPESDSVADEPPPKPAKPAEPDYDKLADAITERLAKDPRFKGPPGAKGDKGDKGDPGEAPQIDYEEIADTVLAKLPPIQVEIIGRDGAVVKSEFVKLGGRLQLAPIYFEQYDVAGKKLDHDTIPLGGTLRIQEVFSERKVK